MDNRLGTAVAETFVVSHRAVAVSVAAHFYRHIGIIAQHSHHLVESRLGFGSQRRFVEVIEDIFHHLRLIDICQHEVNAIFGIGLGGVSLKLLFLVEIPLCAGLHHIFHATLQVKAERAVVARHLFLI